VLFRSGVDQSGSEPSSPASRMDVVVERLRCSCKVKTAVWEGSDCHGFDSRSSSFQVLFDISPGCVFEPGLVLCVGNSSFVGKCGRVPLPAIFS
jgi:hypothetical protein